MAVAKSTAFFAIKVGMIIINSRNQLSTTYDFCCITDPLLKNQGILLPCKEKNDNANGPSNL